MEEILVYIPEEPPALSLQVGSLIAIECSVCAPRSHEASIMMIPVAQSPLDVLLCFLYPTYALHKEMH